MKMKWFGLVSLVMTVMGDQTITYWYCYVHGP